MTKNNEVRADGDSVPALLSEGWYEVDDETRARFGDLLDLINEARHDRHR